MTTKKPLSVGVVVGRFQVASLHPGHLHLMQFVASLHTDLLVVLGTSKFPTPRNPLSFEMRKAMVTKHFPRAVVLEIQDRRSNADWSLALDALIKDAYPDRQAVLYGSRDSFIPYYSGCLRTQIVAELGAFSGTQERSKVARKLLSSIAFRRGVIHGWTTRLPVTRPMVDIAIIKHETGEVLLGGNPEDPEGRWRFPGGLVDQTDVSLEAAAHREAMEEVGHIEISKPTYVGSTITSDWRYKNSGEAGMTTLFTCHYVFGAPRAGDDISRVAWVALKDLESKLVEEHKPLGLMLRTHLATKAETHAAVAA